MGRFLSIVFFLSICYGSIAGQTYSDMDRLYKNLTSKYNKNIRPTKDLTQPTNVEAGFYLVNIKDFEEKISRFAITGLFILKWHDYNMMWDPTTYGGIETFLIPQKDVWKPELVLGNPYSSIQPLGFDRLNIRVTADGTMIWQPGDVYEVTCAADITYYPFDEHRCELWFIPWVYLPHIELFIDYNTDEIDLSLFFPSGQWELMDTEISIDTRPDFQQFIVTVKFRRRPLFNIVNILVPTSLIGLLTTLVFLLPAESGERVGFSVTVLLAMTVFLTIVSDSLPNTSDSNIPRMSYLLLADLVISTLATICTILGLRLHHKPEVNRVPMWLQYLTCAVCWRYKHSRRDVSKPDNSHASSRGCSDMYYSHAKTDIPSSYYHQRPVIYKGYTGDDYRRKKFRPEDSFETRHSEDGIYRRNASDDDVNKTVTWKRVASFCDALCFVFFLLLLVIKNVIAIVTFNRY